MEIGTASDKVSPRVGCFSEHVWGWPNRLRMNVVKPGRRTPTLILTLVGVVLVGGLDELGLLPLGLQRNRIPVKILKRGHWLSRLS